MNSISCKCPFRDAVQQVLQKQELEFTLCEPTMPYVYSGFQSRQDLHLFQTNRYYLFYDSRAKARMSALGQPCSLFIRIAEGQQELLSRISQEYNTKAPHARLHPSCVLPYFCEADIVKHLSFTVDPPARRETQLRLISCMSWYEAPIERADSFGSVRAIFGASFEALHAALRNEPSVAPIARAIEQFLSAKDDYYLEPML